MLCPGRDCLLALETEIFPDRRTGLGQLVSKSKGQMTLLLTPDSVYQWEQLYLSPEFDSRIESGAQVVANARQEVVQ